MPRPPHSTHPPAAAAAGTAVANAATNTATNTASDDDHCLATQRWLRARPAQVFRAFAQPDRLARWWGPRGFASTFHQFDFTPGGHWHFTMHAPDGRDFSNHSEFTAIQPDALIVLRHHSAPPFTLTVTLAAQADGTQLGWQMRFDAVEDCLRVKPFVEIANEQNLDRLEVQLRQMLGSAEG
jgi:hypothetical protein